MISERIYQIIRPLCRFPFKFFHLLVNLLRAQPVESGVSSLTPSMRQSARCFLIYLHSRCRIIYLRFLAELADRHL